MSIELDAEVTCVKHPKYRALRRPRVDCAVCWLLYCLENEVPFYIHGKVVPRKDNN